jgi:hypothetical protein
MSPSTIPRLLVVLVAVLAAGACAIPGSNVAASGGVEAATEDPVSPANEARHEWAPAASADITPGTQTYTEGAGQCTTNFVFVDDAGDVYLGQAAHCASTGESDETDGCKAGSLPLGTSVTFNSGGSADQSGKVVGKGRLAYSSWVTMQQRGEEDGNTCAYNDFALVKVDPKDVGKINPSVPFWGGPVEINATGTAAGDPVYAYGNSSLRGGLTELSPQQGTSNGDDSAAGGWSHTLTSPTPGVPGDSGSGILDGEGRALGTLSTLSLSVPAINGVGNLGRELAYARAHSELAGLTLVLGTESFDPTRLEGCLQNLPPSGSKLPTPDDLSRTLECTGQRGN